MSLKSELDENLKKKEQTVEQLKKDLEDWESDVQQDNERTKRMKQREIEKSKMSAENTQQRKATKEKAYDEKISTIDKALERIEEISKTSPTIQ